MIVNLAGIERGNALELRRQLVQAGYKDIHVPPHSPQLWVHPDDDEPRRKLAIAKLGDYYCILDYDEFAWLEA